MYRCLFILKLSHKNVKILKKNKAINTILDIICKKKKINGKQSECLSLQYIYFCKHADLSCT